MTLEDQAVRRVALARHLKRVPIGWIATEAVMEAVAHDGVIAGLPVRCGTPRSDWGLQLILGRASSPGDPAAR